MPSQSATMIRVENLQKTFYVHKKAPGLAASIRSLFHRQKTAKHAVRGVSFEVREGEVVGLVGANGAGKTTIVKMLAGVIHPSGGHAEILGYEPARRDNRLRRQMALIMGQKAQLWWDLPAADSFLLLKEIYRIDDREYRNNLAYLTELLDVRDELNVQVRRLSLGERMKMELIAALLHAPRVVFLDEPTIGLDLTAQRAIREFILEYRRERQPAMIVTSHYMEDIERLCERILILREGELVYDGSLQEVVDRYIDHKVIVAHLGTKELPAEARPRLERYGAMSVDGETVRVTAARAEVAEAAAEILRTCDVVDLAIEEVEIGEVIERIMRRRGAEATQ